MVAQTVKNLPAMRESWVQSLGWEDPLEKGMATNSSTLAWRIPWREEPSGRESPSGRETPGGREIPGGRETPSPRGLKE